MNEHRIMLKRAVISLAACGALFAGYWLVLPAIRELLLPTPEPGGWVIGPHRALRFAACTVFGAVTLPLVMRPIGREWRAQDHEERGRPRDPFEGRAGARAGLLLKGALYGVIYLVGAGFYFTSYAEIGGDQITLHSLLGTRSYRYAQIRALELVNEPGWAENHAIRFDDESWGYFSADHEGIDSADVRDIARHVARLAERDWILRR